uniref:Uncharacterized protein n=1 Tax=Strombidium rassoulzadegani TaxID=1082188 RepID=A0A7S3CLA8_9SPIT|mmetsp:Transcript_15323/g.25889  ORF Transcript_15323/g.25889 Transcript_15323/m.25889 type:complete len:394 (+) Transcript_15323:124-1305(+)
MKPKQKKPDLKIMSGLAKALDTKIQRMKEMGEGNDKVAEQKSNFIEFEEYLVIKKNEELHQQKYKEQQVVIRRAEIKGKIRNYILQLRQSTLNSQSVASGTEPRQRILSDSQALNKQSTNNNNDLPSDFSQNLTGPNEQGEQIRSPKSSHPDPTVAMIDKLSKRKGGSRNQFRSEMNQSGSQNIHNLAEAPEGEEEEVDIQELLRNQVPATTEWTSALYPKISMNLKMKMNFGFQTFKKVKKVNPISFMHKQAELEMLNPKKAQLSLQSMTPLEVKQAQKRAEALYFKSLMKKENFQRNPELMQFAKRTNLQNEEDKISEREAEEEKLDTVAESMAPPKSKKKSAREETNLKWGRPFFGIYDRYGSGVSNLDRCWFYSCAGNDKSTPSVGTYL